MRETQLSATVQGSFGRVATHTTARALVEHAHFEFNFIFKVGGADTGFRVGRQEFMLDHSVGILVNPWMPHAKMTSEEGAATDVLTILPDAQWLAATLELHDLPLVKLFARPCVELTPQIRAQVDRLARTMRAGAAFSDSSYEPMVKELVVGLTNAYADANMRETFHRRDRPMDARVSRSLGLIREAAAENPNLDDIASRVGLSRSRFFEQFKACVGASPQQYLDWARMAVATKLLASTHKSVADVSHELGFSAASHFARFFAQHMGVAPSEFKRGVITEGTALGEAASA
jgi:AraC-like DNA-binding protein